MKAIVSKFDEADDRRWMFHIFFIIGVAASAIVRTRYVIRGSD
jgi:hypothetical protein